MNIFFSDSADDFEEIRTIDISFVRVADKQSHLKYSHQNLNDEDSDNDMEKFKLETETIADVFAIFSKSYAN